MWVSRSVTVCDMETVVEKTTWNLMMRPGFVPSPVYSVVPSEVMSIESGSFSPALKSMCPMR